MDIGMVQPVEAWEYASKPEALQNSESGQAHPVVDFVAVVEGQQSWPLSAHFQCPELCQPGTQVEGLKNQEQAPSMS